MLLSESMSTICMLCVGVQSEILSLNDRCPCRRFFNAYSIPIPNSSIP